MNGTGEIKSARLGVEVEVTSLDLQVDSLAVHSLRFSDLVLWGCRCLLMCIFKDVVSLVLCMHRPEWRDQA